MLSTAKIRMKSRTIIIRTNTWSSLVIIEICIGVAMKYTLEEFASWCSCQAFLLLEKIVGFGWRFSLFFLGLGADRGG